LHDYKSSAAAKPKKTAAFRWFAVGLGLPLLGLALYTGLTASNPASLPPDNPELAATADSFDIPPAVIDDATVAAAEPMEPEPEPAPVYDSLTLTFSRGDTLDTLFRKNNLDIGQLAAIARLDEPRKIFRRIKPGDVFEITHENGRLVSMYSALSLTSALKIDRKDTGFTAEIVERPIEIRKRHAYGLIETSLFESAAEAGIRDKIIMNIAGIFAWDVDFVLDIRTGDDFYVQFEEIWQNGEFVTDGEIIAAEFNNNGNTYRAVRFIDENGRSDYFTPDGHSVRKAFIRAPVDFTRVSSNFNPRRRHPILNKIRAHRGVDYAAPRGTPIKAAGDGKVIFRGVKAGYGNTVILQHGGNITTLYAHMSRFAAKGRVGSRVRQGQTIGYVGASGLATANHLHYEYRLSGVHRNPRTVELPQADPIAEKYRDQFFTGAEPILEELEQFKRTQIASVAFRNE
jgi:murein DD-endopeptidase MepM/ murein hydrolase activator NlpD